MRAKNRQVQGTESGLEIMTSKYHEAQRGTEEISSQTETEVAVLKGGGQQLKTELERTQESLSTALDELRRQIECFV